jgi:hypothetical protein
MVGAVMAVVVAAAIGLLLDRFLTAPLQEYQPQFVMHLIEPGSGCGGIIVCPGKKQIPRRTPPPGSFGVRPLGLAPPKATDLPAVAADDAPHWEPDAGTWD